MYVFTCTMYVLYPFVKCIYAIGMRSGWIERKDF